VASPKKSIASASSDTESARNPPSSSTPNIAALMNNATHKMRR
jgi:hypothetical protein